MAHAHKHFGAERIVKGETPHASADMNVVLPFFVSPMTSTW